MYEAPLPVGRVPACKHLSGERYGYSRNIDGTQAPAVGRTTAGVLPAVTGPRQLMRFVAAAVKPSKHPPARSTGGLLGERRPKVHSARELHRQTIASSVQNFREATRLQQCCRGSKKGRFCCRGSTLAPCLPYLPHTIPKGHTPLQDPWST